MSDFTAASYTDDDGWDAFVRRSPHGSPFMLSSMLRASSENVERWALFEQGQPVAIAPVFLDANGLPVPPGAFMLYQGMLLEPVEPAKRQSDLTRKFRITETFLNALSTRFSGLEFHQHWAFEDLRPFQWMNYHEPRKGQFGIRLLYTGIANLGAWGDFESYLACIRTLRRREYKRALPITAYEEPSDIEGLLDLHDKTYQRQGIVLADGLREHRRRIVTAGLEGGFGKLACARTESGVASMIYFLYHGDTAYYLFGANDPEQRDSGASTGLMLHMIKDAFGQGIARVDFCGINSPTRGDFKISLCGEPVPYFLLSFKAGEG
jgi:hypothetical protein